MYRTKRFIEMERQPLSMRLLLSSWFDRTVIYSVNYQADA